MHPPTRRQPNKLQIPIGRLTETGRPCLIDLTQPGTHGLLIGASGSGRTHLLRSIVIAATDAYSATELNVAAVDFAGDRTFGTYTGSDRALTVIRRTEPRNDLIRLFTFAVRAEVAWRSQLLREAADHIGRPIPDITAYNAFRESGESLAPLPAQLVVVANYTYASPTIFNKALDSALTAGRRLGINYLFAAPSPRYSNLITSRLSYRIALRTATVQESHDVIAVVDAAHLDPTQPGLGYLRIGDQNPLSFRTTPPAASTELPA